MSGFIGRYENDKENKCREELFFFFFALFLIFSSGCSVTLPNLPTSSTLTEPGFCLRSCPLTEHYPGADLLSLPPPEKKPQLLRSSGVVNKKTGARMLAVAEVTVSSFECDLRGPAGCRSELESVGERNCQLKMWSFVNSHVAFVGVCVHVRDDKFPYHRVNLSQA